MRLSDPIAITATKLQALPDFKSIPHEKLSRMLLRSLIGTIIVLAGLFLQAVQVIILYKTRDLTKLSIPLLGTGIALMLLGATVWSGSIITRPIKVSLGLLQSIVDILRKK